MNTSPGARVQKRVNRYGLSFFHGNSRARVCQFTGVEMFFTAQFSKLATGAASHEL